MPAASGNKSRLVLFIWIVVPLALFLLSGLMFFAYKGWVGEQLPSFEELENPKSAWPRDHLFRPAIAGKVFH